MTADDAVPGTPDSGRPDPLGLRRCGSCGNAFEIERLPDGKTCGHCGGPFDPPPQAERVQGIQALVIHPSGSTHVKRLPVFLGAAVRLLGEMVGGYLEAIDGPAPPGVIGVPWVAYLNEDGQRRQLDANPKATTLARQLQWRGLASGGQLVGTVVFLGRVGSEEVDVPGYVLGAAGLDAIPRMMP